MSVCKKSVCIRAAPFLLFAEHGTYLVFNVGLLILIKMTLEETGTVQAESNPLANDFCGVDQVIKDSTVHSNQSAATWALLLLLVHFPSWLGQDPPLGDEANVLARELLFQLADKTDLDLLECLELRHRHKDTDGLLALTNFDLLGSRDVQLTQVALKVRVHLKVQHSLRNSLFEFIGCLAIGLHNLSTSCERHLKNKFGLKNCQRYICKRITKMQFLI